MSLCTIIGWCAMKPSLKALVKQLWNAEHVGIAIAESTEGEAEQRSLLPREGAFGIAFPSQPGQSSYVDFEKFVEGREAALGPVKGAFGEWLVGKICSRPETRNWPAGAT